MAENQFIGALSVALGVFVLAVVLGSRLRAIRIYRQGSRTQAVVIKSRSAGDTGGYRTRVSFTDEFNVEAQATVDTPARMLRGEHVAIVYDPDRPKRAISEFRLEKARLDGGFWAVPWTNWFFLPLSALFVLFGLLTFSGAIQVVYESNPTTPAAPTSSPEAILAEMMAARAAAEHACGDGTMTTDDLESYKAAIERLGLETSENRWFALFVECRMSLDEAKELLP